MDFQIIYPARVEDGREKTNINRLYNKNKVENKETN